MFIGIIYKITGACGKVYIGSSTKYKKRIVKHNYSKTNKSSSKLLEKPLVFEIIRQDEYKLIRTMRLVEQYYIDNIDCINIQRAFLGAKKKKEKELENNRKYRETHKEEIAEYKKKYHETHREEERKKAIDYYHNNIEAKRVQSRENYQKNKEKEKERARKYRETHKEHILEYLEKNKERIKERERQRQLIKIECKYCKSVISKRFMTKHLKKTKRCLAIRKSLEVLV
jgi:hypothetical protein